MRFSKWTQWDDRNLLHGLTFPGVYAIALSDTDMASTPFEWSEKIIYVGMSNAKGGLKARLQQFENTIRGKKGHGGAERVRFKHSYYDKLVPMLFVSASHTECIVTSNKPSDLRAMGIVAQQEYECLALFAEKFGRLPEFNDKKKSPKK